MNYEELKENYKLHFKIMQLRDQEKLTLRETGAILGISATRVQRKYREIKWTLFQSYLDYVCGKTDHDDIYRHMAKVHNFYENTTCVLTYMEIEYKDILKNYFGGEPFLHEIFMEDFIPYRELCREQLEIAILQLKDQENKNFVKIGKQLGITKQKAKTIYDNHYHNRVMIAMNYIQSKSPLEPLNDAFPKDSTPKQRWDIILERYIGIPNGRKL